MEHFIFLELPTAQQAAIAAQVQHNFSLCTEFEALLTLDKQAVDIAIKEGEAASLGWMQIA